MGTARTRLHLDLGFGDVVTNGPISIPYRTILGNRAFSINTYSDETIAAEKLDAFISLGTVNSRFKDLFDLYELLIHSNLSKERVVEAAVNTFRNRNTALPESPESLSENYWNSQVFKSDWMRFLKRIGATSPEYNTLKRNLPPLLQKIYEDLRARLNAS